MKRTTKGSHLFSEQPLEPVRAPNPNVTIEYRFGSEADLKAATNISFSLLNEIRSVREDSAIVVLNFRALQARRIDEMQEDLLILSKRKVDIFQGSQEWSGAEAGIEVKRMDHEIDELLHKYALALRDYETLSQEAVAELVPAASRLPTIFKASLGRGRDLLYKLLPKPRERLVVKETSGQGLEGEGGRQVSQVSNEQAVLSGDVEANGAHEQTLEELFKDKNANNNFRELDKAAREARDKHKASSERLWMGSFGGLALIVPMLIMVLHRSVHGSLIVTSVGTVLFAVALALAARSLKGMDVLAATAAYAAVLVVFVGSSLPPVA
ncbi:hypothetical protein L207DRAFT_634071 [Hyaloscypha variabilis F]|uniref:DUF6594 domain-containing protein n=1 Tax=Hyaloscypha variabilis (strain UAMH 11265 / GT02V1 / F) TaxID=1149755 RepID=A0A2J6RLT6_HYAVF|nr:hypothetical protein L207DRAFT_634071 [Hyaloscypha variabilis F]